MGTDGCVHVYMCFCVLEWQSIFFFFLMWQKPKTTKITEILVSVGIVVSVVVPSYLGILCGFLKNVNYFSWLWWFVAVVRDGAEEVDSLSFIWICILSLVFVGKFCIRNKKLTSKKRFSSQKAYWLFSQLIWKRRLMYNSLWNGRKTGRWIEFQHTLMLIKLIKRM